LTTSDRTLVAALEQAIVQRIGEPRYNLWFDGHTKFLPEPGLLIIGVPNRYYQEWLERKFARDVEAAAGLAFDEPTPVRFRIDAELFQAARQDQDAVHTAGSPACADGRSAPVAPTAETTAKARARPRADADERPAAATPVKRHWRRLSEFMVGPCNRVAHASAVSVVEAPGQGPNPLVLHGPVGTGKTHLLQGLYAGLRKQRPEWRVCYLTAEDFTNRFVQAMRLGKLSGFRKYFRECDALLVDDVQFLASKRATQEEFQHTFDALAHDEKQVVVTCDVHPKLNDEFPPELRDRLLGGAIWGLQPPDFETRLAILRSKAHQAGTMPPADEALRYVAETLHGNVRELEGALHSLRHYAAVTGKPIDLPLAREALAELLRHSVRVVQLADIDLATCRVLRLEPGMLQSSHRSWAVSYPRMLAIFLARKHTSAAYSEIGTFFGGRNHSTAVAAEKKVRKWLQENGELALGERRLRVREVVELIERELNR
jgi:chromosomal replication initiator protein